MSDESVSTSFVPPKRTFSVEFAVGLFALLGFLAFGYLAINLAGMNLFSGGRYKVQAEFENIAGIKPGAPVEVAGVMVGNVSEIKLNSTSAKLTLLIDGDVKLRDDDILAVRTKGIIGDRYLKIIPGGSSNIIEPNGEFVSTESAVELEEILGKLIHRME